MTTTPDTTSHAPPKRRVGILLGFFLLFTPLFSCWFLLRRGYSKQARVAGFGWAGLILIGILLRHAQEQAPPPPQADPVRTAKYAAAYMARLVVPKVMKDPDSAKFGDVWGMGPGIACGFVNGKNSFGAMAGMQRFIYTVGAVEFEANTDRFWRHWNAICVARAKTPAPNGLMDAHWGSHPLQGMKPLGQTTQGLDLYTPATPPQPFDSFKVAKADYRYDHTRLYAIDLYVEGERLRDAVLEHLKQRYGDPQESNDTAHSYAWRWPDSKISVEMTYDTHNTTQVTWAKGEH